MRRFLFAAAAALALGSAASAETPVNGCAVANAVDHLGEATFTITFFNFAYSDPCIKVSPGTQITFSGAFTGHPLRGGTVVGGTPTFDPSSPIPATDSGGPVMVTLNSPGTVPYYCNFHGGSFSMFGAVIVALFTDGFDGAGDYCEWSGITGGTTPC